MGLFDWCGPGWTCTVEVVYRLGWQFTVGARWDQCRTWLLPIEFGSCIPKGFQYCTECLKKCRGGRYVVGKRNCSLPSSHTDIFPRLKVPCVLPHLMAAFLWDQICTVPRWQRGSHWWWQHSGCTLAHRGPPPCATCCSSRLQPTSLYTRSYQQFCHQQQAAQWNQSEGSCSGSAGLAEHTAGSGNSEPPAGTCGSLNPAS